MSEAGTVVQYRREDLEDPLWRLRNLYRIVTKRDGIVPYRPTPYQDELYVDILRKKRRKHVVVKARRMGYSTAIDVMAADLCIWNKALQMSIVDLTQGDAAEKIESKCRVAWNEAEWRDMTGLHLVHNSATHMAWSNGSHIYGGLNARGGTNHFLHISEWGPIAHEDPPRSKKILTGALPSADEGVVVVETTWMGGKVGELWSITKAAMETPAEDKTDQDFWFHFSPWYEDERHKLVGNVAQIDEETDLYLTNLVQKRGLELTHEQRLWYFKNKQKYRDDMRQEYPSTPGEAFDRKVAGSIYGRWMDEARANGRVVNYELDKKAPVHVFMDLGGAGAQGDSTAMWWVQFAGREINIFDWYETEGTSISEDMETIRDWEARHGRRVTAIYMPHDADHMQKDSGSTLADTARAAVTCDVVVVPRIPKVQYRIDGTRDLFHRFWFHKTHCEAVRQKDGEDHCSGIDCLDNYHTKQEMVGSSMRAVPVHDVYSHSADALGLIWEAIDKGLVVRSAAEAGVFSAEVPVARTRRGVRR